MKALSLLFIFSFLISACQTPNHTTFINTNTPVKCHCKNISTALVKAEEYIDQYFNQEALLKTLAASKLDVPVDLNTAQYTHYTLLTTPNNIGEPQLLTWVKILKDCTNLNIKPTETKGRKGYQLENNEDFQQALEEKNCTTIKKK